MGIKRRLTEKAKSKVFTFSKLFENDSSFAHMHLKFAKSAYMPPKQIFHQISIWIPKKAEFNADFKFGVVMLKKCS
jgi:hypothetical protein